MNYFKKMTVGSKFKLVGYTMIFTVVAIECKNGAFGPQLVGRTDTQETRVLASHEGYTFEKVFGVRK